MAAARYGAHRWALGALSAAAIFGGSAYFLRDTPHASSATSVPSPVSSSAVVATSNEAAPTPATARMAAPRKTSRGS